MEFDVRNLHPLEIKLLRHVSLGEEITAQRLVEELGYKLGQCNQAFSWLLSKGFLAETGRKNRVFYELTDLGREQQKKGTPAQRIFSLLQQKGSLSLPDIASRLGLGQSDVGSAFGLLSKTGTCRMGADNKATIGSGVLPPELRTATILLEKALDGALDEALLSNDERLVAAKNSKKRGAAGSPFKLVEREDVFYALTDAGQQAKESLQAANITGEELGAVTAGYTGRW